MKKVLSLVLVAVMVLGLATTAFAANVIGKYQVTLNPGTPAGSVGVIDVAANQSLGTATSLNPVVIVNQNLAMLDTDAGANKNEGQKFILGISTGNSIADDFNITATVKKGSDIVKATVKKDDKKVEIQAIPNLAWSVNKTAAYKVEVKFSAKKSATMNAGTVVIEGTVTLQSDTLNNNVTGTVVDLKDKPSYEVNKSNGYVVKSTGSSEDKTLNFSELVDISAYMEFAKLYEQGTVNLAYNQVPSGYKDIQKANIDADIKYINFVAAPEFDVAGKFVIEADKDSFIYELKDGKLVESKFAWDDTVGGYSMRTNVLGAYVISDKELKNVSTPSAGGNETNPGTGANDMVNVAVALAVVSLAAAGAVAFKRASK